MDTIMSLPKSKSAGSDGFSAEYYQAFATTLSSYLQKWFTYATSTASFHEEMPQANVIALPKPGKRTNCTQNFRPILLLNTNLKFFAKLITNRLAIITPQLVKEDQVGFVKGRQAPDGTPRLYNLLRVAESRWTPTVVLTLDAKKAFDRVHCGFLKATLQKFGLSGTILSAMALYTNPSARVFISNVLSDTFSITNGTRQGCLLYSLILTLKIELLAEVIRSCDSISGIEVGRYSHKIGLFANDVVLTN